MPGSTLLSGLARRARGVVPTAIADRARLIRDRHQLKALPSVEVDPRAADRLARFDAPGALREFETSPIWIAVSGGLTALGLDHQVEGVNPGDRRALAAVIAARRPRSVLEVGTHVGSSTATITATMREVSTDADWQLTTVDIRDVNDPQTRPWEAFDAPAAPVELMRSLGVADRVRFVCADSRAFLATDETRYDLIFLDGDHRAAHVYAELPLALRRLAPGGLVLLHDYYPGLRRLWSIDSLIPGPYLALERLRQEGARLAAQPMGSLPWPTKAGSNVTSLALLTAA